MGSRGPKPRAKPENDPDARTAQRNLRLFREELGLTQEQAALVSGVSVDQLRRYEQGGRGTDMADVIKIMRAYGRPLDHVGMEHPPVGKPSDLPAFFLVVRPGVSVPEQILTTVRAAIAEANRRYRSA